MNDMFVWPVVQVQNQHCMMFVSGNSNPSEFSPSN